MPAITPKKSVAPVKERAVEKTTAVKAPVKAVATVAALKAKEEAPVQEPAAVKKVAAKKMETAVIANVDVGWGNALYIRGAGGTLSWDKGILMENLGADKWEWACHCSGEPLAFKFLINDQIWSAGDDLYAQCGTTSIHFPTF